MVAQSPVIGTILQPSVSQTARELADFLQKTEGRNTNQHIDTLPLNLRNFVRQQLEEMGGNAGQMRHVLSSLRTLGSIAPEGTFVDDKPKKEARRRFWERLLQDMQGYFQLYSQTVWKVAVAKVAVNKAIRVLNHKVSDLHNELDSYSNDGGSGEGKAAGIGTLSRARKEQELKDVIAEKEELENFRDNELQVYEEKLKSAEPPNTVALETIQTKVEEQKNKSSIFRNTFRTVAKLVKRTPKLDFKKVSKINNNDRHNKHWEREEQEQEEVKATRSKASDMRTRDDGWGMNMDMGMDFSSKPPKKKKKLPLPEAANDTDISASADDSDLDEEDGDKPSPPTPKVA